MADVVRKENTKPSYDAGHVPITEEMDSARWTLPPIVPVAIALALVAAILASYLYFSRKPPTSSGSITRMEVVPVHVESSKSMAPGQEGMAGSDVEKFDQVVVAVHLDIKNATGKLMYIKDIEAKLVTGQREYSDDAANAGDYDRLFQAYPTLKQNAIPPIQPETKMAAGEKLDGMAIFSFQVAKDAWDKRKSFKVAINIYDHAPLILDSAQVPASTQP